MSDFMQHDIQHGTWLELDTNEGTIFLPDMLFNVPNVQNILDSDDNADDVYSELKAELSDFISSRSTIFNAALIEGYGARLSAPGYLDCTEWSVYATEAEAEEALTEMYGDDDDDDDNTSAE